MRLMDEDAEGGGGRRGIAQMHSTHVTHGQDRPGNDKKQQFGCGCRVQAKPSTSINKPKNHTPNSDYKHIICSASNGLNRTTGSLTQKRPPIFCRLWMTLTEDRNKEGWCQCLFSCMRVPLAVSLTVYASVSWSVCAKRRRQGREGWDSEKTRERKGPPY